MVFSLNEFNIKVPEKLIAQYPREKREESRLLILDAITGDLRDDIFKNIGQYLKDDDCLIYNDVKVIHARIYAKKIETGGKLEFLLVQQLTDFIWLSLVNPYRKAKPGSKLKINNIERELFIEIISREGDGLCRIRFSEPVDYKKLEEIGEVPLPKYIKRKPVQGLDDERYQTVFSEKYGAVAAPTAGLHFTIDIINKLKDRGILFIPITLYVDWGTFKPVRETDYRKHRIHSERYEISQSSADLINECRSKGRRLIFVGTTSVRAVESSVDASGKVRAINGKTDLYIYPGYQFKLVDGLITNFHMPDSTLILLVAALAGKENIERAYQHAVKKEYRFFSYGDAMFIIKRY